MDKLPVAEVRVPIGSDENGRQEQGMNNGINEKFPRVTIQFCTQCKWMLRAAYFAQELLSTFGTDIGEVALQPSTGGTFVVELFTENAAGIADREAGNEVKILKHTLWDRKSEGGFPETKELKKRLRNIIDPSRDLGHVDGKKSISTPKPTSTPPSQATEIPSSSSHITEEKEEKVENAHKEPKIQEKEEEKEKVNERGKIVITGLEGEGGFGVCRPGDEECGGF